MPQLGLLPLLEFFHLTLMVSSILAPPSNVTLVSENFQHVLTWDEENKESPIYYTVQYIKTNQREMKRVPECSNIAIKRCDLTDYFTDIHGTYRAAVKSFSINDSSVNSWSTKLIPLEKTLIGPPLVDVVACERSVNITIQPPISYLKSNDGNGTMSMLHGKVYPLLIYTIRVVQPDEKPWPIANLTMEGTTEIFTTSIPDLLPSTNYCISASAFSSINLNTHQKSSAYTCVITKPSHKEDNSSAAYTAGAVVGGTALLVGLIIFLISLDRSGYLCMKNNFFPKVLKSFPKSYSVYEEDTESVCTVGIAPVQIISKPEGDQVSESDEESCGQVYAQRKRLDNAASEKSGGDSSTRLSSAVSSSIESSGQDYSHRKRHLYNANSDSGGSGLLSSAGSSVMESSGQDSRCTTEEGIPEEHPSIFHNQTSGSNSLLCSPHTITTSSLLFHSSEPFNVNLNSVMVRRPDDLWPDFKEVIPKEGQETSADGSGSQVSAHELSLFPQCIDTMGIPPSEFSGEEDFISEASDASDSEEHFVSGYMRR